MLDNCQRFGWTIDELMATDAAFLRYLKIEKLGRKQPEMPEMPGL